MPIGSTQSRQILNIRIIPHFNKEKRLGIGNYIHPKKDAYILGRKTMTSSELLGTDLIQEIMPAAAKLQGEIFGYDYFVRVKRKQIRNPNPHEFYVMKIGTSLINLVAWAEQLDHLLVFLGNYRTTPAITKAGINQHHHLQYHVENYYIRVSSLLDRMLMIIDAVFNLDNDPKEIRFSSISNNLKVKRSDVPKKLRSLNKLIGDFKKDRNIIVHQRSFVDDDFRLAEMLFAFGEMGIFEDSEFDPIPEARKLTRALVKDMKSDFQDFNKKVFSNIIELLEALAKPYRHEVSKYKALGWDVVT